MYISRAIIAGYAFWLGYQVHKHQIIPKTLESAKATLEELTRANARAWADEVTSYPLPVVQLRKAPDAAS